MGDLEGVADIRGLGLMIGIELDRPCGELVGRALDEGLLINVTAERVVRLLPPLVFSDDQADSLITELSALIRSFIDNKAFPVFAREYFDGIARFGFLDCLLN